MGHPGIVPALRWALVHAPFELWRVRPTPSTFNDAMFADGNRQLLEVLDPIDLPVDPRAALKAYLAAFADFAVVDPARKLPALPSGDPGLRAECGVLRSGQEALGRVVRVMNAAGVTDRGDNDCLVAMTAGLIEAQLSNEPGGDRWLRHLNRMTDVLVDNATEGNPR